MQKNKFIRFIVILVISFTLLNACADEPLQLKKTSMLDKITTLVHKKPHQIEEIENILGFKFSKTVSSEYFNTATASKTELGTTKFSSIEYKYGFQKENPLRKLKIIPAKENCLAKADIMNKFGNDFSRYIPKIHHWSKKEVSNPYGNIVEYYIYKINRVKLSIGFFINPKTGKPVNDACVSKFIINYNELEVNGDSHQIAVEKQ